MERQTGGNAIRAQGGAFKLIEMYGFQCPSEIDLESIAIDRGLEIKTGGLRGCEARLLRLGKNGIVRTRSLDPQIPRTRFAIAHELGHWELHTKSQAFVCTPDNQWNYPAKDRSGRLAPIEQPDLGMLLSKLTAKSGD